MSGVIKDGEKGGNEARVTNGALWISVGVGGDNDQHGSAEGVISDGEKDGKSARVENGVLKVEIVA